MGKIEDICRRHGVKLVEAAFLFPLRHPAVLSVVPGGQTADEMRQNLEVAPAEIPEALGEELEVEGPMREGAPTGGWE